MDEKKKNYFGKNTASHFFAKLKLYLTNKLSNKVDKEDGKGLSTNDYTTDDKNKLAGLKNYELPTASTETKGGVKVGAGLAINNGVLSATGGGTADSVDWENVQGKPTKLSDFTNDEGFQKSSDVETVITNKGYQTASQVESAINTAKVGLATEEFVTGKGYQTSQQVETAINNKISSVMKYKGTVANYSDLPTNASVGDTYNITNASANNKAGDNAAWNGTNWDILAGTIDLSNYTQTSDFVEISDTEVDEMMKDWT